MSNLNCWEERYKELSNIWGIEAEYMLAQYESLVQPGKVLDIGIGEGRNSLKFAMKNHEIIGIDVSETALERCERLFMETPSSYRLIQNNIEEFEITGSEYALIISAWSLNFMKKSSAISVFKAAQKGLVKGGLLYLGVFSVEDPQMKEDKENCEIVEKDSYFIESRNIVKTYFEKNELLQNVISDCEVISIKEDISLDIGHGKEHYHGAIELMLRKK